MVVWTEFMEPWNESFVHWINSIFNHCQHNYLEYLLWLLIPIFVIFIFPLVLLFFVYGCVIFLHIYGLRNRIREAYASSYWDGARTSIASFWDGVGYVWHGYECHGLENIPDEGPALIVAYHSTLPFDVIYFMSKCILYKKRAVHGVADKFLFKFPFWGKMFKVFGVTPGTIDDCVKDLNEGNLLIILPGGAREAIFSNPVNYKILWGKRLGFAKVVLQANVPIIPLFTENSRDSFRTPKWGRKCFRSFYEKTKIPFCPIYGGFPVKMITHLGQPITFPENSEPEDVKRVIRNAVADLIREHQRLPGSILHGMLQRFRDKHRPIATITTDDILNGNREETTSQENSVNTEATLISHC